MIGRPYRYNMAWSAPSRGASPFRPYRPYRGLGTNGNGGNGNGGNGVDTSQFTRGAVVAPVGMALGAGLSALIGRWAGRKWGKAPDSGRNWAMIGAGLSLGTSLITNKRSTGRLIPSSDVVAAHRAWLQNGGRTVTPIVLPGATAGPQPTNGPAMEAQLEGWF